MTQILGRETAKKHEKIFKELERLKRAEKRKKRREERGQPYLHIGDKKLPIVDGKVTAPDLLPKGEHYLEDGKWKPVLEAKHGKLIKGFPKLTKRGWK